MDDCKNDMNDIYDTRNVGCLEGDEYKDMDMSVTEEAPTKLGEKKYELKKSWTKKKNGLYGVTMSKTVNIIGLTFRCS